MWNALKTNQTMGMEVHTFNHSGQQEEAGGNVRSAWSSEFQTLSQKTKTNRNKTTLKGVVASTYN